MIGKRIRWEVNGGYLPGVMNNQATTKQTRLRAQRCDADTKSPPNRIRKKILLTNCMIKNSLRP